MRSIKPCKCGRPLLIDEYQRLPAILGVVKRIVDSDNSPGSVVLTGSATGSLLPKSAETLAGRVHEMTMWGLSQGELAGVCERFLEVAFEAPLAVRRVGLRSENRRDYATAVASGGFPQALSRERESFRRRWLVD